MADEDRVLAGGARHIDFQTDPSRYRHWKLDVEGDVATLTMDVDENGGLFEGYQLKLNSYDLAVDIELSDAGQGQRVETPSVKGWRARCSGCALSTPASRWWCCAQQRTACSAPAPISACWRGRPTPTRSTSANSPTRPATGWKIPARTPGSVLSP